MPRFLAALEAGPLVVDGAMGTELFERGIEAAACLEELVVTRPDLVRDVHEGFLAAGADVIETNTFGANGVRLARRALAANVTMLNEAAASIARAAANGAGRPIFVAGAIGPTGHDDLAVARTALGEQARALVGAGVDVLVLETFHRPNELRVAVEAAVGASGGIPVVASATVDENGRLHGGATVLEIARLAKEWGASAVGVNCSHGPENVLDATASMRDAGLPIWTAPSAGLPREIDGRLVHPSTPESFGDFAKRALAGGARLVGGCCGTTPEHVRRIASAVRVGVAVALAGALALGCKKDPPPSPAPASSSATAMAASALGSAAAPPVVAESLPRCRMEGAKLAIPGDDAVVGDAVVAKDAFFVGVVRRESGKRLATVFRVGLDLSSAKPIEVAPAFGDDPPPTPRLVRGAPFVTYLGRGKQVAAADAGPSTAVTRTLQIARIDPAGSLGAIEARVSQQADESLAYDVAWPDEGEGQPLVAWDEDAAPTTDTTKVPVPGLPDRGVIRVQLGAEGARSRIASPETSDAESPRLLARPGGYFLAWLAKKPEPREGDGGVRAEGPGEHRAFRWVEMIALDAKGETVSPVRRVSPERGRAVSFELVREGADVVVLVQDEAARVEGGGERLVRWTASGEKADKIEGGDQVIDAGVGQALAELVPSSASAHASWLAFADPQERMHLVPVGAGVRASGVATAEPTLDGARVLGSAPGDVILAVAPLATGRLELRRLVCR